MHPETTTSKLSSKNQQKQTTTTNKPRSKNHQDAARSASNLSPSVLRPRALLNAVTAASNVDSDTAPGVTCFLKMRIEYLPVGESSKTSDELEALVEVSSAAT